MLDDWKRNLNKIREEFGYKEDYLKKSDIKNLKQKKERRDMKSKGKDNSHKRSDNVKNESHSVSNSSNSNSQTSNLGYAFQTQDTYHLKTKTAQDIKAIIDFKLDDEGIASRQSELQKLTESSGLNISTNFRGKITYPGLVIGMSNPIMCSLKKDVKENTDENKNNKNDALKTGFTFDYVTGLPYVPGSSIKGMLRNSIIKYEEDIKEYLGLAKQFNIENLAEELFGDDTNSADPKHTNTMLRDIFLEAIVVKGDKGGHILKEDYITPHETPFSDPRPIHILALRPNVEMEFYFILRKEEIAGLSAETRFELYKELILELGIGAKTNTGYGNLIELKSDAKAETN